MDEITANHAEIVEMLPDYALGALDDADIDRIARHLGGCAGCRAELQGVLETLGLIAAVPPPGAAVRGAVLARALGQSGASAAPAPLLLRSAAGTRSDGQRSRTPWGGRAARLGLVAAALLLYAALGAWNVRLQRQVGDGNPLAALLSDAVVAHPLTDSEVSPPATGYLVVAPDRDEAVLVADDLPPLPEDQRYQIWLFGEDGGRVGGGLFSVEPDGRVRVRVEAPAPFAAYVAIGVSAEPVGGSPAPTSPLALGGWLPT